MQARRFSARALWGLASWALPLAVVFLITPQLLHALGPERFGVLMIILVTPLIAAQLDFGIASSSVRRLAAALVVGRVDVGRTLTTLAAALGLIGLALGTAVWLAASSISAGLGFDKVLGTLPGIDLVHACAVWIALSVATLLPGIVARASQALVWITAVQTMSTVLLWLGALLIVRADRSLTDIVALGVGLGVVFAIVTALAMRRRVDWSGPLRFDYQLLAANRSFSVGMFGSQIASTLVYQGDRILILAVGSPAIAGAYALCVNVANKTLAAVVAMTSFVFPHAAALYVNGGHAEIEELSHALNRAVTIVVVPLLVPGWVLAEPFLALWLGKFSTIELTTAFRVLWLAFAIPAFAVPIGNILAASGHSALAARFSWLTALVVLGSIVLLVPRYGLIGAAIAMLLGMSTSFLFRLAAQRTLRLHAAQGFRRFWLGVGCGVFAQAALLVSSDGIAGWPGLLLVGGGAWAIFYLVRVIFGLLSPEEKQLLKRLAAIQERARKL
ncbi:MAG: polysaccharide biosynthesis C-terminal domain-containing protein [Burkholderiaceae bacterium]